MCEWVLSDFSQVYTAPTIILTFSSLLPIHTSKHRYFWASFWNKTVWYWYN